MMYKTLLLLLRMVQHIDVLSWHYRYKPVKCVEKVEGPNFIVDSPELMLSKPVGPVPAELPYSRITGQPNLLEMRSKPDICCGLVLCRLNCAK